MDADNPTFRPRFRVSRHSPVQYDRSSSLAFTSEAGPSHLPNFSQILDLDTKDMPLSDDQLSSTELNTPKITTTLATTRSDNPAAVLRALMSRLPAHPPSPTQSYALSVQDGTERESDFDTVSESNAAQSIAQESLKHIFSKALRDPGNTPQKARRRRNSIDASEVEASPRVKKERATNKGKRRSMSDDEVENTSQTINRRNIRSKPTPQPITMEFLRERFSHSHNLRSSVEPQISPTTSSNHDFSNNTATILRELNSSQATPPAATSTPQQSLRLSTSSHFQFHSNLLDQDSEMQKAIEGLDSYDGGGTHGQASVSRASNSSKALEMSPVLRHHSSKSSIKSKPTPSNSQRLAGDQSPSMDDLRTPSQHPEQFRADPSKSPSPALQQNSPHSDTNAISDSSKFFKDRSPISRSERHLHSEVHSPSVVFPPAHLSSSSDEPDYDSPPSNAASRSNRYSQSNLKWTTPKPPGGWLNTPKPSREGMEQGSPINNVTQCDGDIPLATNNGLSHLKTVARAEATHTFQSFSKTPKPPGGWVSTPAPAPSVDSPLDIPERNRGLLTPAASLSKGSNLEPKTPAIPGAWLATPAVKKSILKVRFEPPVSELTDKLVESVKHSDPKSPLSFHRQKSPKSPKIRVLDAFGREQEPDVSNQECVNNSPSPFRVVDAMGHDINEGNFVEGTETPAASYSASSRGELLSRIRNGLDDLVVGIDGFDKDDEALSIDHDRVQQLTTISRQARGLRERLYSRADNSRSLFSSTLGMKTSWFPANPRVYIFLFILQLSFIWLMYRISIIRAQQLFLNTYYDPFNPELHLYIFKSDASLHVLRSEGARTTSWSSLVGHILDRWIHFIGSMLRFWQVRDNGAVLQYDNAWTPT